MKTDFSAVIEDLNGDAVKDGEKDAMLGATEICRQRIVTPDGQTPQP